MLKSGIRIFLLSSALFSLNGLAERTVKPKERAIWDKGGKPLPGNMANSSEVNWEILKNSDGQNDQWAAVGAMKQENGKPSCTLTLIEPPGNCPLNGARKALALTNGHCIKGLDLGGSVIKNQSYSQKVQFNHFIDSSNSSRSANINSVVYGTTKGHDIAIVELNETYDGLMNVGSRSSAKKIIPKKIGKHFNGQALTNLSVPTSGIHPDQQYLRQSHCSSLGKAVLSEGGAYWPNQLRFNCPVVGGSSGSSLFNEESGEIMGLINTGTTVANQNILPCATNEPCELDQGHPQVHTSMNYGFDVTFLHRCATASCDFDPSQSDCPLPSEDPPQPEVGHLINDLTKPIPLDKNQRFSAYQVKIGKAGVTDCQSEQGYTTTSSSQYSPTLPADHSEGVYVLCVRGKKPDGSWQELKNTATRSIRLDRTPPVASFKTRGDSISIGIEESDDRMQGFVFKISPDRKGCANNQGYRRPSPIEFRSISLRNQKGYVCARAMDIAGNFQSPENASVFRIP